jgi:hypothetical protein
MTGVRHLAWLALLLAGCPKPGGSSSGPRPTPRPATLPEQIVYDFERAVLDSQDAFLALFDFVAVGEVEILLHRYDALGRWDLDDATLAEYLAEDGTPYPPERERKNVGSFYDWLIRPAIADGNCQAMAPTWPYDRMLGEPFEPLPPGHDSHEALRLKVNAYLEHGQGGVIGIRCPGGTQGLALMYTRRDNDRGYDLITIYEDDEQPQL